MHKMAVYVYISLPWTGLVQGALLLKKSTGGTVEKGNEKLNKNYGPSMADKWDKFWDGLL